MFLSGLMDNSTKKGTQHIVSMEQEFCNGEGLHNVNRGSNILLLVGLVTVAMTGIATAAVT